MKGRKSLSKRPKGRLSGDERDLSVGDHEKVGEKARECQRPEELHTMFRAGFGHGRDATGADIVRSKRGPARRRLGPTLPF